MQLSKVDKYAIKAVDILRKGDYSCGKKQEVIFDLFLSILLSLSKREESAVLGTALLCVYW